MTDERPAPTWPGLLSSLLAGTDLTSADTAWAMEQVMSGEATPVQVAGFAVALRAKGEAPDEITGLVRAMLGVAARFTVEGPAVDTCGTGGDRANTVNISTMSAMVVAGTGARVVKHGNRSASSACDSADLLEELGVVVDLDPPQAAECLDATGVTFCFAPRFHPRCGTPPSRGASSASPPSSTSSARSPTPPSRRPRRSAARTPGWRG